MTTAMILAAGEGQRMLPLTADTPKPLLKLTTNTLLQYQIEYLGKAGVNKIVVNASYLADQIENALSRMRYGGMELLLSREPRRLETGGALAHALPLLGDAPFVLLNSDALIAYPLHRLTAKRNNFPHLAHLVLVENPSHNQEGDFFINEDSSVSMSNAGKKLTFSGLSLIHPTLLVEYQADSSVFPLVDVFRWAILQGRVSGECFDGAWLDVGTPERLEDARKACLAGVFAE